MRASRSFPVRPRQRQPYSGRREDLGGLYVRSRWEANYARYLNFLLSKGAIKSWEYEPERFTFPGITRGTTTYTPDFRVTENDGSVVYHEVKGYMDAASKTRHARMAKFFPEVKILMITRSEYRDISHWKRLIAGWED